MQVWLRKQQINKDFCVSYFCTALTAARKRLCDVSFIYKGASAACRFQENDGIEKKTPAQTLNRGQSQTH